MLEIDLLRQGKRRFRHKVATSVHYLVSLVRAGQSRTDLWAVDVKDRLPVVPVPLKLPDLDVVLDLQKALEEMYEEGFYADSINYKKTPPMPAFSTEDEKWLAGVLQSKSTTA